MPIFKRSKQDDLDSYRLAHLTSTLNAVMMTKLIRNPLIKNQRVGIMPESMVLGKISFDK